MLQGAGLHVHYCQGAFASRKGGKYRLADTLGIRGVRLELVDHELDEMGLVPVQLGHLGKILQLAVNAYLRISALAHLVEELLVMAFTPSDERSEKVTFAASVVRKYEVSDLLVGIADHLLPGGRGIGPRSPGV